MQQQKPTTKPPSLPPKPPSLLSKMSQQYNNTSSDDIQPESLPQSPSDPPPVPKRQHIASTKPPEFPTAAFHISSKKDHDDNVDKEGQSIAISPVQRTSNFKLSPIKPAAAVTQGDCMVYEDIQPSKREQLSAIVTDSSVLPMKVAFCDSIYGFCESFTFSSNELFDVHFLKKSTLANIRTSTGKQVKVPLQAPFQYTLDYPPSSICDAEYKVPQLMKLTYLPTVAIVKNGSSINNRLKFRSKSSGFEDGEVLIFKGRIKSSTIECFSMSQKEKKRIHKSSGELTLTTNPSQLTFTFTDLMFFDLPLQIKILATPKLQPKFKLTSTVASLIKEESLITSFADAKMCDDDSHVPLYEIFVDAPIDFQKTFIATAEKQKLIEKTENIFERFSPEHVQRIVTNVNSHSDHLQKQMYDTLNYPGLGDERWKNVTELIKPSACFVNNSTTKLSKKEKVPSHELPTLPDETSYDTIGSSDYYTSMSLPSSPSFQEPPATVSPKPPLPPQQPTPSSLGSRSYSTSITRKESLSIPNSQSHQDDLPKYLKILSHTADDDTEEQLEQLRLVDLSCDQVLSLLDKLGLSKYKNLFIEEKISGSILQELDEDMLEQDLGITSKLHRLKLRRVIEGREPLDSFFQ